MANRCLYVHRGLHTRCSLKAKAQQKRGRINHTSKRTTALALNPLASSSSSFSSEPNGDTGRARSSQPKRRAGVPLLLNPVIQLMTLLRAAFAAVAALASEIAAAVRLGPRRRFTGRTIIPNDSSQQIKPAQQPPEPSYPTEREQSAAHSVQNAQQVSELQVKLHRAENAVSERDALIQDLQQQVDRLQQQARAAEAKAMHARSVLRRLSDLFTKQNKHISGLSHSLSDARHVAHMSRTIHAAAEQDCVKADTADDAHA